MDGILWTDAAVRRPVRVAVTGVSLLTVFLAGNCGADPPACSQLTLVKVAGTSVQSAAEVPAGTASRMSSAD